MNNKNPNQDYYDFVRRKITLEKLKESYSELWKNAESRVLNAELGNKKHDKLINERLDEILKDQDEFILIGGPPCQAYSLAGRSRRLGTGFIKSDNEETEDNLRQRKEENSKLFYEDKRHKLFEEYIKITINRYNPKIFVMENVKDLDLQNQV